MATSIPEKSVFVAIGAWNPAIIQPGWLRAEFPQIIPDQKITVHFNAGPASYALVMDLGKFLLDPNGGRLVFVPKVLDEETLLQIQALSKGIYKKLAHTPVSAAGSNFVFRLDSGEDFAIEEILECAGSQKTYAEIGFKKCIRQSVQHSFSFEDYNLNITFLKAESDKTIQLNYDYPSPVDSVVKAADALRENYRHALTLCDKFIRRRS